jgi:preprotein translocase subunit SecB
VIQKIYVKDLSYESPGAPAIFRGQWKPEVKLELNTQHALLEQNMYEVVLHITATIKLEDKTAFLVELKEAGIFTIAGLEGDNLEHALASFCPGIIFPYAREVISDLVVRGGFPQLNLAPINFEMVYQQSKKQQTAQKETAG